MKRILIVSLMLLFLSGCDFLFTGTKKVGVERDKLKAIQEQAIQQKRIADYLEIIVKERNNR